MSDLYKNWESSPLKLFRIFNHYQMDIAIICVKPGMKADRWEHFLFNSSLNTCRERIKYVLRPAEHTHTLNMPSIWKVTW